VGPLLVERAEAVWRVTLNRPEKLNALDEATRSALADVIGELAASPDVRVLVLRGAGRAFCAGADVAQRLPAPPTWAARRHAAGAWQRLLDALEALPQVTVAALHGHVIGGGALLAVACDLRVAAGDVAVSIPEVALGIPLTWGGVPRLAREVGLPMARDLVLTGRRLDAAEAVACGFAQRVVPASQLGEAVDELVAGLVAQPPGALALARASLVAVAEASAGMAGAWADADLLSWSLREGQSPFGQNRG
jgi:enoyl-CoA hydratase/carnithine racemase